MTAASTLRHNTLLDASTGYVSAALPSPAPVRLVDGWSASERLAATLDERVEQQAADHRAVRRSAAVLLTLALLSVVPCSAPAQTAPPDKLAKSLERVYGAGARVDTVHVDSAVVYRLSRDGALLGFAQVRNVKGKEQPITFLVAIDSADALRDIDILVYREPYGGEVAYEPWRKQFRGKTAAAPLQLGKDIRSVSGATISSNAVTRAVRRTLADLTAWHAAGRLK